MLINIVLKRITLFFAFLLGQVANVFASEAISLISDCPLVETNPNAVVVLDAKTSPIGGWSHIREDNFPGLKHDRSSYAIGSRAGSISEGSCSDTEVLQTTLVVKYSDWDQQHANGVELVIDQADLAIGSLAYLVMDLKLNRIGSYIPSVPELRDTYQQYDAQINWSEFDHGKASFGISLFEEGALDQSSESLNLEYHLDIDQVRYFDKWIRVSIPIASFETFLEQEYRRKNAKPEVVSNANLYGFRLTAETSRGKQLRNILGEQWHLDIPEVYKELSISLASVSVIVK